MRTITLTLEEKYFDWIVRLIENARSNSTMAYMTHRDSTNADLRGYAKAHQEEATNLGVLIERLHTNRIIQEVADESDT